MFLRMMLVAVLLLTCRNSASGEAPTVELTFASLEEMGQNAVSSAGPASEPAVIVLGSDQPSTTRVAVCESPGILNHQYVVRGRVKYEDVAGDGYLELLNDFGSNGEFFTRTLSATGPMSKLTGTSDWREFELPFDANPGMKPRRLTLRVVLPGQGKVAIAQPLMVLSAGQAGDWWSIQQGGWVGGIGGMLLGIFGGLAGLSARRKRKHLAVSMCSTAIAFSLVSLIAGIAGLEMRQPFHVFYPLLLIGGIGAFAIGLNLRNLLQQIRSEELRKIQAADAV